MENKTLDNVNNVIGTEAEFLTDVTIKTIGAIAGTAIGTAVLSGPIFHLIDSMNDRAGSVNDLIVTLPILISEDIPKGIRDDYCSCLEVLFGSIIKSTVDSRTRMGTGDARVIMRTLPFLTQNEKIKLGTNLAGISDIVGKMIKEKEGTVKASGSAAVSVFLESVQEYLDEENSMAGMEADGIFSETGRSGLPKFVNVEIIVKEGNKMQSKKFQIGVRCIPKIISKNDALSFFVKHNIGIAEDKVSLSLWDRLKKRLSFGFIRSKAVDNTPNTTKTLEAMMKSVNNIKKPFVSFLLSDEIREKLADNGIDITKPSYVRSLYRTYPIATISFFDGNSDTFLCSLLQDSVFVRKSVSEMTSEKERYERVIGDMVRANRLIS